MSVIELEPGFKFHELLAANLEPLKRRVLSKDRDVCILVTGKEGFGKSMIAQQIAYYFDRSFDLSRLTFGLSEFKQACLNAKPGQAVQGDELLDIFAGRAATSKQNREMMQLLAKIRQRRLFMILVCPSVFEIDRYAVLHRADLLIHCFSGQGDRVGFFNYYGRDKLKDLYIQGKRFMDYKVVTPDFQGTFTQHYVVDENEYRKKKDKDLMSPEVKQSETKYEAMLRDRTTLVLHLLKSKNGMSNLQIANEIGATETWVSQCLRRTVVPNRVPNQDHHEVFDTSLTATAVEQPGEYSIESKPL